VARRLRSGSSTSLNDEASVNLFSNKSEGCTVSRNHSLAKTVDEGRIGEVSPVAVGRCGFRDRGNANLSKKLNGPAVASPFAVYELGVRSICHSGKLAVVRAHASAT